MFIICFLTLPARDPTSWRVTSLLCDNENYMRFETTEMWLFLLIFVRKMVFFEQEMTCANIIMLILV